MVLLFSRGHLKPLQGGIIVTEEEKRKRYPGRKPVQWDYQVYKYCFWNVRAGTMSRAEAARLLGTNKNTFRTRFRYGLAFLGAVCPEWFKRETVPDEVWNEWMKQKGRMTLNAEDDGLRDRGTEEDQE